MAIDLVPGDNVGGSFVMFWFEFACAALELMLCALRIGLSSEEDGDELMLEALTLVVLKCLFFAREAGS